LDSLLHNDEVVDYEGSDDDDDGARWGEESFGWRLPSLTQWKAILMLTDDDSLSIVQQLDEAGAFDGDVKPDQLHDFLEEANPCLP
jgi:hypothetical protein